MKKIIAMDMDGTLLRDDKTLSDLTKKYIRLFHHKHPDIAPVICSGRPKTGIMPFLEELGMLEHPSYVVSQNGANVFETQSGKRLYDAFLSPSSFQQWIDLADAHHVGLAGVGIDVYYTLDDEPNSYVLEDVKMIRTRLVKRTYEDLLQESLYKFLLFESPENLDAFEKAIPQSYREDFYVVRSQPYLVEVMPKGINKATGLAELTKILGLELSDVMAIGDEMNDYEMLSEVGFPVAMGNATQAIKDIAALVTLSNEEDGVVYAISHWVTEVLGD